MSEPPCPTKVKLRYAITGPSAGDPPAWTVVDLVFGPVLHASKKECEDFIAAQDPETWTTWFEDTPFGVVRWQVDADTDSTMTAEDYARDMTARPVAKVAPVVEVPDGPPMCPCQYSMYKDGVAVMCFRCLGPQQYYRSDPGVEKG